MNAFIGLEWENFALCLAQSGVYTGLSMSTWSLGNIWWQVMANELGAVVDFFTFMYVLS